MTRGMGLAIKQAFSQINRNKVMSLASLFSITAIMLILGVFFIVIVNITNMTENVKQDFDQIQVYLKDSVDPDDKTVMIREIEAISHVEDANYLSKEDAMEQWKEKWGDNADLLDRLEANPLPNSIIFKVDKLDYATGIVKQIEKFEGVEKVNYSQSTVDKLLDITNFIQVGALIVIIFLVIISIMVVSNTIKLTVLAREKEITIMRYVGATNWFIRGPFLLEGVIIGIISAAVSSGLVALLYHYIVSRFGLSLVLIMSSGFVSQQFMNINLLIIFLSLGISIGAAGSIVSMRRFLAK
ncbi:MAG: permease-like cell division protein FtsX [Clostridiales Family XIII bacterium]|jgi:cell division transport system permease protein|nr:permease-like cell division protein FtsX [Clostridiales Family XIII bacterium]